jgi:hypothetical protein
MGMIQLPQLQESLLLANDRLVARSRRRAQRFRLGLMTSAAVVSLGGAAVAGVAIWGPELGREDGNRPTASASPVPQAQSDTLGVLARDQTAADRGAVARAALAAASRRYVGIRLDAVRVLYRPTPTTGIALVPVADLRARPGAAPGPIGDALCVHTQEAADDFDVRCVTVADVREGQAVGIVGDRGWGLVPDGVARASVAGAGGRETEVPVRSNLLTVPSSAYRGGSGVVEWLDADGRTIVPEGGAPMTLPEVVASSAAVPPGYHDCGAGRGRVVPEEIECGPPAVRWGERFGPRPGGGQP